MKYLNDKCCKPYSKLFEIILTNILFTSTQIRKLQDKNGKKADSEWTVHMVNIWHLRPTIDHDMTLDTL